jgi:hypothetical protein
MKIILPLPIVMQISQTQWKENGKWIQLIEIMKFLPWRRQLEFDSGCVLLVLFEGFV